MVRGRKDVRWGDHLEAEDLMVLAQKVEPTGWYPMDTFERLGVAILKEIAHGQLEGVRMWGRFQLQAVRKEFPMLVAENDPRETLMRFDVLSDGFFDYGALGVVSVSDGHASVWIDYKMGKVAEETASYQTMGFFEGLLEAAGATDIHARFTAKVWDGAERTMLELHWTEEPSSSRTPTR